MRSFKICALLSLCVMVKSVGAQFETFEKEYAFSSLNEPKFIVQDNNGGSVLVGQEGNELLVCRTFNDGSVDWSYTYSGTGTIEVNDFIQLSDGSYAFAGELANAFAVGKIDATGNFEWIRQLGTTGEANGIIETNDGNLCAVGRNYYSSTHHGAIIKLSFSGSQLWTKETSVAYQLLDLAQYSTRLAVLGRSGSDSYLIQVYESTGNHYFTREHTDVQYSGVLTLANTTGFLLSGTKVTMAGGSDIILTETSTLGTPRWSKTYGGNVSESNPFVSDDGDGYIVSCTSNSFGNGIEDTWVFKTMYQGAMDWSASFGDATNNKSKGIFKNEEENGYYLLYGQGIGTEGFNDYTYRLLKTSLNGKTSCQSNLVNVLSADYALSYLTASNTISNGIAIGGTQSASRTVKTPVVNDICLNTASNPVPYQKVLGSPSSDYGEHSLTFPDESIVSLAFAESAPLGGEDCYVSKVTYSGDTLWTSYLGTTGNEGGLTMCRTEDNGIVIAGYRDFSDVNGYIIKLDENGNIEWTKEYDNGNFDEVRSGGDGYIYVVGGGSGNTNFVKLDLGGNELFNLSYDLGNNVSALEIDKVGNIIVTIDDFPSFNIFKLNSSGTIIDNASFSNVYRPEGILIADDGYLLTGRIINSTPYLIKLDNSFNIDWSKTFSGSNSDIFYNAIDFNNHYKIAASFGGKATIISTDYQGNVTWAKSYGDLSFSSAPTRIIRTHRNGFFVTSSSKDFTNGLSDLYIINTDSLGNSNSPCYESNITVTSSAFGLSAGSASNSGGTPSSGFFDNATQRLVGSAFNLFPGIKITGTVTDVLCSGNSEGAIDVTVEGGISPYTFSWSSGQLTEDISNVAANAYTITVTDNLGCVTTESFTITEPAPISIMTSTTETSCHDSGDGTATATVTGGVQPYNYLWSVGQQSTTAIGLFSGNYIINIVDANGCLASNIATVTEPSPLEVTFSTSPTTCGTSLGSALANPTGGTPGYTILWNGTTSGNSVSNLSEGIQQIQITDDNGCVLNDSVNITSTVNPQEICAITVDSSSTNNVIVWEKDAAQNIEGYKIYRNIAGAYSVIGYQPYDSLSQFTDNSFGINPNVTSYRYRITAVDTCGNESVPSDFHETIHLTVNQGVSGEANLIWDNYEGFAFNYYRILRDSTGSNNWEVLDSVTNSNFTYTDFNVPLLGAQYAIEIVVPGSCTSSRANHNTTRSNKTQPVAGPGTGTAVESMISQTFQLYPNPNQGEFRITFKSMHTKEVQMRLYSMSGTLISEQLLSIKKGNNDVMMSLSELSAGIYFVELDGSTRERFVINR